jgi:hypothetical protein
MKVTLSLTLNEREQAGLAKLMERAQKEQGWTPELELETQLYLLLNRVEFDGYPDKIECAMVDGLPGWLVEA